MWILNIGSIDLRHEPHLSSALIVIRFVEERAPKKSIVMHDIAGTWLKKTRDPCNL